MNRPLIDVIVPVYNGAKHIPGFLDRMEKQAEDAVRFLFVDDGSTDDSLALLLKARETRRLPMEVLPRPHGGVSAARNAGIEAAEAEYIAFFDVDDTCTEDYTAALRAEAEKGGFEALAFFRKILFDPKEPMPVPEKVPSRKTDRLEMLKLTLLEEHRWSTGVYCLLLRRDFIRREGLRCAEGYPYYEDMDFQYRALAGAERICRLDRRLYGYIVKHEGSAMAKFTPERVRCLALLRNLEKFFDEKVPEFAPLFRRYAVARTYWSVLWQAALAAPSREDFYRFAGRTKATVYMRRLKGYPDRKVQILRGLFLISKRLYCRTARVLGKRYTLLEKVSAETLEEAARLCPEPGEGRIPGGSGKKGRSGSSSGKAS